MISDHQGHVTRSRGLARQGNRAGINNQTQILRGERSNVPRPQLPVLALLRQFLTAQSTRNSAFADDAWLGWPGSPWRPSDQRIQEELEDGQFGTVSYRGELQSDPQVFSTIS